MQTTLEHSLPNLHWKRLEQYAEFGVKSLQEPVESREQKNRTAIEF